MLGAKPLCYNGYGKLRADTSTPKIAAPGRHIRPPAGDAAFDCFDTYAEAEARHAHDMRLGVPQAAGRHAAWHARQAKHRAQAVHLRHYVVSHRQDIIMMTRANIFTRPLILQSYLRRRFALWRQHCEREGHAHCIVSLRGNLVHRL